MKEREVYDLTARDLYHLTERRKCHLDFFANLAALAPFCMASALSGKGKAPKFEDFVLTHRKP